MAKYCKKPVVIEAFQWDGSKEQEGFPKWFLKAKEEGIVYFKNDVLVIKTLEGDHIAREGEFIIQGVKGELYPCKEDIFHMTYMEV